MNFSKKSLLVMAGLLLLVLMVLQACSNDPPAIVSKGSIVSSGPTYTPTFCPTPVGDSTIESANAVNANYVYANKYTFSAGTVNALSIYTYGIGQFNMALYGDNGSGTAPGNLLAQTAAVSTLVTGWNIGGIPAQAVTSGTYWLAFQTSGPVTTYYTNTGSTAMPYIAQSFGAFPGSYTGYSACSCSVFSMRALYCP